MVKKKTKLINSYNSERNLKLEFWNDNPHLLQIVMIALVAVTAIVFISMGMKSNVGGAIGPGSNLAYTIPTNVPSGDEGGVGIVNANACNADDTCETSLLQSNYVDTQFIKVNSLQGPYAFVCATASGQLYSSNEPCSVQTETCRDVIAINQVADIQYGVGVNRATATCNAGEKLLLGGGACTPPQPPSNGIQNWPVLKENSYVPGFGGTADGWTVVCLGLPTAEPGASSTTMARARCCT